MSETEPRTSTPEQEPDIKSGSIVYAYQLRPGMIVRRPVNLYIHGVKCKPKYSLIIDGWGEAEPIPEMPHPKYTQRACSSDGSHVSDFLSHVDSFADVTSVYVGYLKSN